MFIPLWCLVPAFFVFLVGLVVCLGWGLIWISKIRVKRKIREYKKHLEQLESDIGMR